MSFPRATPAEAEFAERRSLVRREVSIPAKAGFRSGPPIRCTVRNISPMGAMLEFVDELNVPPTFRIVIDSEIFAADCEVRHVKGRNVGVMFTSNRLEAMARFS